MANRHPSAIKRARQNVTAERAEYGAAFGAPYGSKESPCRRRTG